MSLFIEVDYFNLRKDGEKTSGDIFLLEKDRAAARTVCTLSDGLGSGVKANVLANITATMAQKFVLNNIDIKRTAQRIMTTLPVCSERHISYATFSIVDIKEGGKVRMINYDNPPFILHHGDRATSLSMESIPLESRIGKRKEAIHFSEMDMDLGDRLIFFSDGVTQSGMGTSQLPLGWRQPEVLSFVNSVIDNEPDISARDLSRAIVQKGEKNDCYSSKDDITCGVIYFRKPRHTMLLTGAPMSPSSDTSFAQKLVDFDGLKIVSGGTTSLIISRELKRPVTVDISKLDKKIPPPSIMEGIDLISEGMITLSRVVQILEEGVIPTNVNENAATRMVNHLLNSDKIHFVVGTKINEAHQNPDMPVEMGIRRTIVSSMIRVLEKKYLKETFLEYI